VNHACVIHTKKGLQGHTGHITQIAISEGHHPKIVSASWDCSLRVWDYITGNHLLTYLEHRCRIFSVAISSSDLVISAGQNHQIHIWSLHSGDTLRILFGHTLPILSLSIANCPPSRPYSSSSLAMSHRGSPSSVALSSNDSYPLLASGGEEGKILIWNLSSYDLICSLTHPTRISGGGGGGQTVAVVSVALSKLRGQSTFLVSGGTCGTIAIWKLSTQELVHVFDRHFGPISGLVIHEEPGALSHHAAIADPQEKDPLLVSCSADWTICIWNLAEKKLIRTLAGHSGGVECLALYTPSQRRSSPSHTPSTTNSPPLIISSGRDETIRVWDLETGTLYRNLEDHSDTVYRVAISSTDTSPMVISGMTTLAVARPATTAAAAAIVSGGADCCLQLWNLDRIVCDINWTRRQHFGQFIYFLRHISDTGGEVCFYDPALMDASLTSDETRDSLALLVRKLSPGKSHSFLRACFMDDICYLIAAFL
jgi:WD40 repeat protein